MVITWQNVEMIKGNEYFCTVCALLSEQTMFDAVTPALKMWDSLNFKNVAKKAAWENIEVLLYKRHMRDSNAAQLEKSCLQLVSIYLEMQQGSLQCSLQWPM